MYAEYAKDPRMKLNLGIRRRLAPLLDNGRDEIELMHAILFSLPGLARPLLRRRDRDGRQHLPRRPRRRAHADAVDGRPQRRLLARRLRAALPAAADGPGLRLPGRERRGAAAHADLAAALAAPLHRAAQGSIRSSGSAPTSRCAPENPRIFAHVRRYEDDIVLCVHNLARSAQAVELDLSRVRGHGARGDVRPHALPARSASCRTCSRSHRGASSGSSSRRPESNEPRRRAGRRAARRGRPDSSSCSSQRWFGSKSREVAHAACSSTARRCASEAPLLVGRARRDPLPARGRTSSTSCSSASGRRRAAGRTGDRDGRRLDVPTTRLADPQLARELVDLMRAQRDARGARGRVDRVPRGRRARAASSSVREVAADRASSSRTRRSSSTTSSILKVYRRLEPGVNPELELLRFLTERGFPNIAALDGWYAYVGHADGRDARRSCRQFVAGAGDGWELALDELDAATRSVPRAAAPARRGDRRDAHRARLRLRRSRVRRRRSRARRRSRCSSRRSTRRSSSVFLDLPDDDGARRRSPAAARRCASGCASSRTSAPVGRVIRHHGDYHLGQVLWDERATGS